MNEACLSGAAGPLNRPGVRFNPYLLFRRGMLPLSPLKPLVPAGTWALIDQAAEESARRQAWANLLSDSLYKIVSGIEPKDRQLRHNVLQLRRDVHNDRLPAAGDLTAAHSHMEDATRQTLEQWKQSLLAEQALLKAAEEKLAEEMQSARKQLGEIAGNERFIKGIQLSGDNLYRDVRAYLAYVRGPGKEPWTKKLRQIENTVLRYVYRMALRTTPFGSFTEIGAQPWHSGDFSFMEGLPEHRSMVRLSRSLLVWMAAQVRRIHGSDDFLLLWLNNTLHIVDDHMEAFTRGIEGGMHSYWGESFANVRMIGPVMAIVEALADGPRPKPEILELLVSRGVKPLQAQNFIRRLIEGGICHEGLGIPDQSTSYASDLSLKLRRAGTPEAAECAECLEALQEIERAFGEAGAEEREGLIEKSRKVVLRFAELCDIEAPVEAGRALIFEDLGAHRPARTWNSSLVERNVGGFAQFLKLLPIFHHSTIERLGLYRWFASRFGPDGRCDDVLTLYRLFSEQSPEETSDVLQAKNDPDAGQVRALQHDLLRQVNEAVAGNRDAPVFQLDPDCLDEIAAALPECILSWTEASFRVQIVPAHVEGGPLLVVNDVSSGHGVFYSRFCDLLEPADPSAWSLRRALSTSIAENSPDQADLTAVFGHNPNLHPRLTPREVVYPGSVSSDKDALTLRDIAVESDSSTHTLRLIDSRDGRPVQLTPMNFLFPAGAPMLYRFLCSLTPLHTYRISFWNRLHQWTQDKRAFLPRLMLGELVIERSRWYVPISEIAQFGDEAAETASSLSRIDRWRRERGLPRECFFQVHEKETGGSGSAMARNWVEETRRWALRARNTRKKSQYLDFRNPFLLRLFMKLVSGVSEGEVLFQECLPPGPACSGYDAAHRAEEFLIELHAERREDNRRRSA